MAYINLKDSHKIRPLTLIEGDVAVYINNSNKSNYRYNMYNTSNIDYNAEKSEYISRKYSKYWMNAWILTIDPISYYKSNKAYTNEFQCILTDYLLKKHVIDQEYDILGVCQTSQHNGLHCHFCVMSRNKLDKNVIESLNKLLNYKFKVEDLQGHIKEVELIGRHQEIKSTCSYINYLQSENKGTFFTITSNNDMKDLFIHFDRTIIFPEGSAPKKLKITKSGVKLRTDNELVLFFMQKLHDNITDYSLIMQDTNIQSFLHIPNLKSVWENCLTQFKSSLTHEKNILHIFEQIEECYLQNKNVLCPCAMQELLKWHNIDEYEFGKDLITWLFGLGLTQKKNTLLLMGPPDTGKSYFARILWELFYCHERIINDGLFSFAPAPGAGCLLWEETHISPELADMTKLIMEGNPSVCVAIKNKPSQMLNKRIPLIITNNKEMGVYCQDSQAAFNSRAFRYDFKFIVPKPCSNLIHKCPFVYPLDHPNRKYTEIHFFNPQGAANNEVQEASVTHCTNFHGLTKYSVLSYIFYCIKIYPDILLKIPIELYSGTFWENLNTLKTKLDKSLCSMSIDIIE